MAISQRTYSNIKSWLAKPVIFLGTLYSLALTCSMAGMEATAWLTAIFFTIFLLVDRLSTNKQLQFHTLGIELPLFVFVGIVVAGLKINAPNSDFWFALGSLRNLVILFVFTYALQMIKNLNRLFAILVGAATIIAVYATWQHFTGVDIWRGDHRALMKILWGGEDVYASVGLFSHHLTYGHSFMMILCLPWATLLLGRKLEWWKLVIALVVFGIILTSIIYSFGRGVWIALAVALPIMAFFASRKLFFITLTLIALTSGVLYKTSPLFRERASSIFMEHYHSNTERRQLWQANMEMFHDHPWIGVGYRQNEPLTASYYERLGIHDGLSGHAHSNYVELLSTTGVLGFTCYMLFILAFVLMTARLYSTIPTTHFWHRVIALSALGAQLAFHVGGLTQWNFGDAEVQHQFFFWLAVVSYMSQRYYAYIVPDDHSI